MLNWVSNRQPRYNNSGIQGAIRMALMTSFEALESWFRSASTTGSQTKNATVSSPVA